MAVEDLWGSPVVYGLPRSHWHCQLTNFDWASYPSLLPDIKWFIAEMDAGNAPHLILTGRAGIGKTHLSVGLYRYAVRMAGTADAVWIEVPQFCDQVKSHFGGDSALSSAMFSEVESAHYFMALDDIFGRELSPWELVNVLVRFLNAAHRNRAALVVTTNYQIDQLATMLNPHEFDRLKDQARIRHLTGRSRRHADD